MRRVCPACARRTAELVAPDCSVCAGSGVVVLHPAALSVYDPEVVSEAVGLALESCARMIDGQLTLSDDRRGQLGAKVSELVAAQIIATAGPAPIVGPILSTPVSGGNVHPIDPARSRRKRRQVEGQVMFGQTPEMVAETCPSVRVAPYDMAVLKAPRHVYGSAERPLMRGLPVLSAAGHPSHLARIEEPQDPYGSTGKDAQQRTRRARQARVLAAAAPLAIAAKVGS